MNDKDFELLSQYLDGELDELSTRRMALRLSSDAELRATLNQMATIDEQVQLTLASRGEVPAHVAELLRNSGTVAKPQVRQRRWPFAVAASVAAIAGVLLSFQMQTPSTNGPTVAEVLEITPSMAEGWQPLADGKRIRPVLSFRDVDGAWCREYLVDNHGEGARGVACRDNGAWETRIAVAAQIPGSSDVFRPASASDIDAVADYTARRADGVALSAAQESELIAEDWQ